MQRVFGLPAGPLSVGLAIALVATLGAVTVVAARNAVFFKIGLRNIPRRRSRSALIVLGLMLGTTIIASALLTGDTMATTVRGSVLRSLGTTDEVVIAGTSAGIAGTDPSLTAQRPYFAADRALTAVRGAAASLPVDNVAAAIVEPVAAQDTTARTTDPKVTLFAP